MYLARTPRLMRSFTVSNSCSKLLVIHIELWVVFFSSFFFNCKVSGVYMARRKPSRPQIILLLFLALFIISALLHTIPLLLDILPTVISVLACTLFSCFLLLSPLRSMLLPISCQASPWRITKGIGNNQTTLPSPQKQTWVLHNQPFISLSVAIKKH